MIGIFGSLFWSKTLMKLIFNPFGEFRWSPEGSDIQIHYPHLQVGTPGIFSVLLRSVQMLKRERGVRKATGSYRTHSIPRKTAVLIPEFTVEALPSAELQPWFLRFQWRICPWAEHSDDDDIMMMMMMNTNIVMNKTSTQYKGRSHIISATNIRLR